LVFLAPDDKRAEELADAVRDYLAWSHVASRTEELNLTAQQAAQARARQKQANDTVTSRIGETYIWALVPTQPDPARPADWDEVKVEGAQDRLADRVSAKLKTQGLLATTYGSRNMRMDLDGPLSNVWSAGHVRVGDLWGYYTKYPYLTRLKDRAVLDRAIADVMNQITWEAEGFALAAGFDEAGGEYRGLAVPHEDSAGQITDSTLLVEPGRALAQRERDREKAAAAAASGGAETGDATGTGAGSGTAAKTVTGGTTVAPRPAQPTRFYGSFPVSAERYARDFGRVSQEILQHLAATNGTSLRITVEIEATNGDGFSPDLQRTVSENARTLHFDTHGFEGA